MQEHAALLLEVMYVLVSTFKCAHVLCDSLQEDTLINQKVRSEEIGKVGASWLLLLLNFTPTRVRRLSHSTKFTQSSLNSPFANKSPDSITNTITEESKQNYSILNNKGYLLVFIDNMYLHFITIPFHQNIFIKLRTRILELEDSYYNKILKSINEHSYDDKIVL